MPLNWIKKNETYDDGQIHGACLIASVVALICLVKLTWGSFYVPSQCILPYNDDRNHDGTIVEIAGETDRRGIYFLPSQSATIDDLFRATGISDKIGIVDESIHRTLVGGDRIVIYKSDQYLKMERIDDRTRLALDMPIDINNVGLEDLLLVPGIGLKTAERIMKLRERKGRFSKREDLKMMNGIGAKRYERIKGHFFVGVNE